MTSVDPNFHIDFWMYDRERERYYCEKPQVRPFPNLMDARRWVEAECEKREAEDPEIDYVVVYRRGQFMDLEGEACETDPLARFYPGLSVWEEK